MNKEIKMEEKLQKVIQEVFCKVEEYLPQEWEKCCFYAAFTVGTYTMKFYVKNKKGEYVDCFNLGIDDNQLTFLFMDIDDIIRPYRDALDAKQKWSVLTLLVESSGKFGVEFDYTEVSENSIDYQRGWEKKYLN